jgi:hypothetical protein
MWEASGSYDNFNQGIEGSLAQASSGPAHHGVGALAVTLQPQNIGVLTNTDCLQIDGGVGKCTQPPANCMTNCGATDLYMARLGLSDPLDATDKAILPGDVITFWVYLPSGSAPVKLTKAALFINSGDSYWTSVQSVTVTTFPPDTWVPVSLTVPASWQTTCSAPGTGCVPLQRVSIELWFDKQSGPGPFYIDDVTRAPSP